MRRGLSNLRYPHVGFSPGLSWGSGAGCEKRSGLTEHSLLMMVLIMIHGSLRIKTQTYT